MKLFSLHPKLCWGVHSRQLSLPPGIYLSTKLLCPRWFLCLLLGRMDSFMHTVSRRWRLGKNLDSPDRWCTWASLLSRSGFCAQYCNPESRSLVRLKHKENNCARHSATIIMTAHGHAQACTHFIDLRHKLSLLGVLLSMNGFFKYLGKERNKIKMLKSI